LSVGSLTDLIFHNIPYANDLCRRNIEMTPPSKVQMALFRFLGLRKEVSNDGGVDERTGVFTA
jgi:hypothetical protein